MSNEPQRRWNVDIHRRVSRLESILNSMDEYQEPLTLWQKISRLWNRSRDRAIKHELSELRKHMMTQDEAVQKLTETQANQATTIANLVEGNAEINGLVAGLKSEIDALKAAAATADLPANIAALIDGLAASSKEARDRSQEIADIVKPVEPPPQG